MAIMIMPYTADHVEAVRAFNARLRVGGAMLSFPESHVPAWLPKVDGRTAYHEYFLAVDESVVRGAYILKHQQFWIGGQLRALAEYRLPFSEGQVDNQFASVGVQMYLDAMRKQPLLYTVGIGGYDEPAAQMLIKAGWSTWLVPFYFRVLRPARFLRNIVYLRRTRARSLVLDALAATGLGHLAVHAYQALKTRSSARDDSPLDYNAERGFGDWADEIWRAAHPSYAMIGLRDAATLDFTYPANDPRWVRLKVTSGSQAVGWAVVLSVPMQNHNYFGNMQVGSIIDCLALPGMESRVARAAVDYLKRSGADIVVANFSHGDWRRAMETAGCQTGPSNFIFAASKKVTALLEPFEDNKHRMHMTRGDGGGPQNLLQARQ